MASNTTYCESIKDARHLISRGSLVRTNGDEHHTATESFVGRVVCKNDDTDSSGFHVARLDKKSGNPCRRTDQPTWQIFWDSTAWIEVFHEGAEIPYDWYVSRDPALRLDEIALWYLQTPEYSLTISPSTSSGESKKPKLMTRLNNMVKRLLDADTQKLIKVEYLDRGLQLTSEGRDALLSLLFNMHRSELVKMAEEEIAERKEEKGC